MKLIVRTSEEQRPPIGWLLPWVFVWRDYDSEQDVYAWFFLAPFAALAYWWRYGTPLRWSVERWMQRRVADKPEGACYNFALLGHWRNWRRWTWRRTRAYDSPLLQPGLRRAFIDDYANWTP